MTPGDPDEFRLSASSLPDKRPETDSFAPVDQTRTHLILGMHIGRVVGGVEAARRFQDLLAQTLKLGQE
jgi:hypothetical protein